MKSKIVFILHLPPPYHGAAAVGKNIFESTIINSSFECRFINLSTSRTFNEIGKNHIRKIPRYFSILRKLLNQMFFFKPELVYLGITAKGKAFYKDAFLAFIIKCFGVKIVYHFHNKGVRSRQDDFFDDAIYRITFKNAQIILLSKYLYNDVKKYIPEDATHYCPNGIRSIPIRHISTSNNPVKLLFFSNLMHSKGIFILLDACKILKEKEISFQCNIAGQIGDISKNELEIKTMNLGLGKHVFYHGPLFGIEKNTLFKNSDIFVLPTISETFGIVNIEAMMHKLPVISTFEGGIPDIVEDGVTGFLIPKKNIKKLAEKIEILIKNPTLRHKMGIAGEQKFKDQFTLDIFENKLHFILNRIIEINRSR